MILKRFFTGMALCGTVITSWGQNAFGDLDQFNTIITAVPFLMISPDARAGGMGDGGVATLPVDANAMHWNPAKLAFIEEEDGSLLSLSYTPWLNRLVPDINLAYLSYAKKLGQRQAIGVSMRYFTLGDINFTDENGNSLGTFTPNEFAFDAAYSLKFTKNFSGAVALRYIYSNLFQGQQTQGLDTKAGQSVAADVALFYASDKFNMKDGQKGFWGWGMNISNVGNKISYSNADNDDFIPTNLRLGGLFGMDFDRYNTMIFNLDINKLLVPTPPIREQGDANGNGIPDEIIAGRDDNVDVLTGMVQALTPAAKPNGFTELMQEIIWNPGVEYWYDNTFSLRGGYQYESRNKGNRQYFTLGLGIRYNVFGLDFAYLIPANSEVRSPLQNTLRFSLLFDFGKLVEE